MRSRCVTSLVAHSVHYHHLLLGVQEHIHLNGSSLDFVMRPKNDQFGLVATQMNAKDT